MERIDYDKSGTIEFQEFVMLMKKVMYLSFRSVTCYLNRKGNETWAFLIRACSSNAMRHANGNAIRF